LDRLPDGLDETYDTAVERIRAHPKSENVEISIRALKWVTFARRRLRDVELLHALAVKDTSKDIEQSDLHQIEKVISLCGGLVALDRITSEVRLVHETTQQYFQKYFRGDDDGDAGIVITCLRYFSFPTFSHPVCDKYSFEERIHQYRLSIYASENLFVHIREGQLEERFYKRIVETFGNEGTCDSVHQLCHAHDWSRFKSWGLHLLHLASMHGLRRLCGELLTRRNEMMTPQMYFLVFKFLLDEAKYV
jgi:hypothetical protein